MSYSVQVPRITTGPRAIPRPSLADRTRCQAAYQTNEASAVYFVRRESQGLVEELEERERVLKKAQMDNEAEKKEKWRDSERIMEDGGSFREDRGTVEGKGEGGTEQKDAAGCKWA